MLHLQEDGDGAIMLEQRSKGVPKWMFSAAVTLVVCLLASTVYFAVSKDTAVVPAAEGVHVQQDGSPFATIIISLDGFRHDYFDVSTLPTFARFKQEGVQASSMKPHFPSVTFPNHYSLVTGLYPESHGIVSNTMYDPDSGRRFSISSSEVRESMWWGGEPIWVTSENWGKKSAIYFWPGSEAEIKGVRPTYYHRYSDNVPNEERVDTILEYLALPEGERPEFVGLYFNDVDDAGHYYGPSSPELVEAVEHMDQLLGRLMDGLRALGQLDNTDIVVVSDHGMTEMDQNNVAYLDDYIDFSVLETGRPIVYSPVVQILPTDPSYVDDILANLTAPGVPTTAQWYKKEDLPDRFHFFNNDRIAPIIGVADLAASWMRRPNKPLIGNHGFDNELLDMHGIFLARGPSFKQGVTVPLFEAHDVYNVLAYSLHVPGAPNNGSSSNLRPIMR